MVFTAGLQLFNIVLFVVIFGCGIFGFVTFLKVLFKLDKALTIWIEQNDNNKRE